MLLLQIINTKNDTIGELTGSIAALRTLQLIQAKEDLKLAVSSERLGRNGNKSTTYGRNVSENRSSSENADEEEVERRSNRFAFL